MNNKPSKPPSFALHLPKTAFPMKARLPQKEPDRIKFWREKSIYQKLMNKQKNKPLFCFIDGPPYANGRLHIGHALNKILKDITVKYAQAAGKRCPFVPIWDCHGLPIELAALKKNKLPQKALTGKSIRALCRQEAQHWVNVQKQEFERLGVLADWDNPLLTCSPEYEADILRALANIAEKKLLYRGKKPVNWCPALQTAIASSEVEYKPHKSPSIYVKFPAPEVGAFFKLKKPCFIVIWTTTPWTLPANQAICLKAGLTYSCFEGDKEFLILAEDLQADFEQNTHQTLKKTVSFTGQTLERKKARHPFLDQDSLIILGDHVSHKEGTGCVHTAPGHGVEDFTAARTYQLPVTVPVDSKGKFTSEVPEWEGLFILKANPLIIEKLKQKNMLLAHKEITHNYPFNPRSGSPLIFRAVPQWFISFNSPHYPVRNKALQAIKSIQFYPAWGKRRLESMIQNAPDWCVSRQRHWGVPIPVFHCLKCSFILLDSAAIHNIADQMEATKEGIEYWFSRSPAELLPPNTLCSKCGSGEWKKGEDILDVWFDSGVCFFVYQKKYGAFPADIYLEGSDQHRGWFQTSLNSSICLKDSPPFKALLTHCFINDAKGYKMSKSRANVVTLQTLVEQKGADIVRLWVSSEDYSQDIQVSDEILARIAETYRRFRNTVRFMIGNLFDFTPDQALDFSQMLETDQWILGRLAELTKNIKSHYDNFLFHKVYQELNVFFANQLSSLYLDILKDRLYTFKQNGRERKSAQTALHHLLNNLLRLLSPITTFLSEEAWEFLPGQAAESILLADFPAVQSKWLSPARDKKFNTWLQIRKSAYALMENMRKNGQIGSSLEGKVIVKAPPGVFEELNQSAQSFKEWLIVSQVDIQPGEALTTQVQKADGEKCARCWHYSQQLNYEKICRKCVRNLL